MVTRNLQRIYGHINIKRRGHRVECTYTEQNFIITCFKDKQKVYTEFSNIAETLYDN